MDRTGLPRTGAPRTGTGASSAVNASTPKLDAITKWLDQVSGVHTVDLGGISALSQTKIAHGLEKHGRPVTKVNSYMIGRLVARAQSWLASTSRPTKDSFWNAVDAEAKGVVIERIANAGGDLRAEWASHPLTKPYARAKAKRYPGKPMGQASGDLLSDLRSTGSFAVTTGGRKR